MCSAVCADEKHRVLGWGVEQQTAFKQLKQSLIKEGNAIKHIDPARELILYTDWCVHGIGAILGQVDDNGSEYMCA